MRKDSMRKDGVTVSLSLLPHGGNWGHPVHQLHFGEEKTPRGGKNKRNMGLFLGGKNFIREKTARCSKIPAVKKTKYILSSVRQAGLDPKTNRGQGASQPHPSERNRAPEGRS